MSESQKSKVIIHWYDHDCPWITKDCDENHRKFASVQKDKLDEFLKQQESRESNRSL